MVGKQHNEPEDVIRPSAVGTYTVLIAIVVMLAVGCTQHPPASPAGVSSRPAARAQPLDWFHQQLAAARAARRDHQPKTDTVGAQQAYDNVMHTACIQAAVKGPGNYPARCDAILHPASSPPAIDACQNNVDDPATQVECSD